MRSILVCAVIFLAACKGREQAVTGKTAPIKDTVMAESLQSVPVTKETEDSFSNFYNAVMVEYCVPLPAGWKEEYTAATAKAQHVFSMSNNKNTTVTVQGLLRSDTSVSLPEYYLNTYTNEEDEATGKIIEVKQLFTAENCFYAAGYWNNSYYKSRFIEFTWLRPDAAVTYNISLPVADTAFWYRQLRRLVNYNTGCK